MAYQTSERGYHIIQPVYILVGKSNRGNMQLWKSNKANNIFIVFYQYFVQQLVDYQIENHLEKQMS